MKMNKSSLRLNNRTEQVLDQAQAIAADRGLAGLKRLNSQELFSGARELVIEHAGDEYRLRLTNQGKLILTK